MNGCRYFLAGAVRVKPLQAKHVSTDAFLAMVEYRNRQGEWILVWEIAEALGVPVDVARAKLRRLIDRGMVQGCACGCRGDIELLPRGALRLGYGTQAVLNRFPGDSLARLRPEQPPLALVGKPSDRGLE